MSIPQIFNKDKLNGFIYPLDMTLKLRLLCGFVFVLSSCATGEKSEKKSPLNYLSGDHYQANQSLNPLEIKRIKKSTLIEGSVYFVNTPDDFKYPVRFQKVVLAKNNIEVASSTTNSLGKYKINSYIENGEYLLKLDSNKFVGEIKIEVKDYKYSKEDIMVKKILK